MYKSYHKMYRATSFYESLQMHAGYIYKKNDKSSMIGKAADNILSSDTTYNHQ